MIIVTAAIIEQNNKILLARRKLGKHLEGYWEFPGGKIEKNESPEECLKRELWEEFSIQTEIKDFFTENIHKYPDKKIKLLAYRVKLITGKMELIEHDKIEWARPKDIVNYKLAQADKPIAIEYLKFLKETS